MERDENGARKKVKGFPPWQPGLICKAFLISGAADMLLNLQIHYQSFHMQHLQIA